MERTPSVCTAKEKRIKDFSEVICGLTKKQAIAESTRCPQCTNAVCAEGCPLGIDIPGFMRKVRENDIAGAYERILEQNPFPGICGRICPAPCEKACILNETGNDPVSIKALERYVADKAKKKTLSKTVSKKKKGQIAVIGSGSAGLMCAAFLLREGFDVTLFEGLHKPGGVLYYSISPFRLPQKVLDEEIGLLVKAGGQLKTNMLVGQSISYEEIKKEGYRATVVATGCGTPVLNALAQQYSQVVYYTDEVLMSLNFIKRKDTKSRWTFRLGKKVVVVGNGEAALDCARSCIRIGRETTLVYPDASEEIKGGQDIMKQSEEEGVTIEPLTKMTEILPGKNRGIKGVRCVRMDFADPDKTGKWRLIPVKGSDFEIAADTVIVEPAYRPNPLLSQIIPYLRINKNGSVYRARNSFQTSVPGVFAVGSVSKSIKTIVRAMSEGKQAAEEINRILSK